jgi:hypothetical protein
MSPTSYQAAPPRVIDTTRLAALLQLLQLQVLQVPISARYSKNFGTLPFKLLQVFGQNVSVDIQSR